MTSLTKLPRSLRLPLVLVFFAVPFVVSGWLVRTVSMPAFLATLPLLAPLYIVLLTPGLTLFGLFRYHSPFLLSVPTWRGRELHLGTSFDRIAHGLKTPKDILVLVCDGLLAIANDVARGRLDPKTELVATSHFFSPRTARSLGFEVRRPGVATRAMHLFGWVDAVLWTSIGRGRVTWLSPLALTSIRTTAGDLAAQAPHIRVVRGRLSTRNSSLEGGEVGNALPRPAIKDSSE